MTTYIFNTDLAAKLEANATNGVAQINALLALASGMDTATREILFAGEFDFRRFEQYPQVKQSLIDAAHHAAWSAFFSEYGVYHENSSVEYGRLTAPYLFNDSIRRRYAGDIKALVPFNVDNASTVYAQHIADTTERTAARLNAMLDNCGASWKKRPPKFAAKMTLRSIDGYGDNTRELGVFMRQVCRIVGIDFTYNDFWANMRNNRRIDGAQFSPVEGAPVTLELHANGNATLRIGAALVTALNAAIGAK